MKQVKRDGVVAMNYLYNAKGERVYRSGSGETVHTVYDEAGHWLGDYDAAGSALQQAIWLDDLPVGLLVGAGANQKLLYLEPDALGSPRVAIDPDRDVAMWRWDLTGEAFGNSAPNEDPDADNIKLTLDMRFPGQRYDAASELNYNYYRDYDPTTGRYIQSDPIGLAGGASTYGYSRQNPETNLDPLGLRDALGSFMRNYSIGQEDTNIGIASLKDFFDAIERAAGFDMTARKLTPCEKGFCLNITRRKF